jgi:hypothetical protein
MLFLFLNLVASLFKSKSRLEAENAALRQQLIVLQRKVRGRVQFTNSDRLFFANAPSVRGNDARNQRVHPPRVACTGKLNGDEVHGDAALTAPGEPQTLTTGDADAVYDGVATVHQRS